MIIQHKKYCSALNEMSRVSQTEDEGVERALKLGQNFCQQFFFVAKNVFIANYKKNFYLLYFLSLLHLYLQFISFYDDVFLWCSAMLIVVQLKNQHTTKKKLLVEKPFPYIHCSRLHQCFFILFVYDKRNNFIFTIIFQYCIKYANDSE